MPPIPPEEDLSTPPPPPKQPPDPARTYVLERERQPALEVARHATPDPFYHWQIGWIGEHHMISLSLREEGAQPRTVFVRVRFGPTANNPRLGAFDLREEFEQTHATERGYKIRHVYAVSVACQKVAIRFEPDPTTEAMAMDIGGCACKAMVPLLKALEDALRRSEKLSSTFRLTLAPPGSEEPPRIERGIY